MSEIGLPESLPALTYERWQPNTQLQLCNVTWDNSYRDIVAFNDKDELNAYLDSQSEKVVYNRSSYAKPGYPVLVDLPFNVASQFNYIRVHNPAIPADDRDIANDYYYFITSVNYIAPNTTELSVQLDVWQTYRWGVEISRGYVERGHITVAATAQIDDFAERSHLLCDPEGLEQGSEYVQTLSWTRSLGDLNELGYVVYSTIDLQADPGTTGDPNLTMANGGKVNSMYSGANVYYVTNIESFLSGYKDFPWITQGILGIFPVPAVRPERIKRAVDGNEKSQVWSFDGIESYRVAYRPVTEMMATFPGRYNILKKLATQPYSLLELTMNNGTPIYVGLERLKGGVIEESGYKKPVNPEVYVVVLISINGPTPRIMYYVAEYGADKSPNFTSSWLSSHQNEQIPYLGDFLGNAGGVINIPSIPVLNNGYLAFMANNANTLAYQRESASWAQQRALMGAETSRMQANAGIALSQGLTESQIMAGNQSTVLANAAGANRAVLGAIGGVVGGGVGGAMSGGPAGAAAGIIGSGISGITGLMGEMVNQDQRSQQNAINASASRRAQSLQSSNAAFNRDTNYELARQFANGDYANAIAGINARVNDARMTPPTMSGQVGGDSFLLSTIKGGYRLFVNYKRMPDNAVRVIGEFWLRYGYASNTWCYNITDILLPMKRFCYWKLKETTLGKAHLPTQFHDTIRGIFEKGVTVWRNPVDLATLTDFADNRLAVSSDAAYEALGGNRTVYRKVNS